MIDLENNEARGDLWPALGERVHARSENDVLVDPVAGLFFDQVLDEAGAGDDGRAEEACGVRVHVRAAAPAIVWGNQPEANFVLEHVRRRIELEVHGPPQGHSHRRAV
jgi:hypothetical protein